MDLDEWGDDGGNDELAMMQRNTSVLADRMRTSGFQQGTVTVGEQEAERVAMEVFGEVAHAAHNIAFATGACDAMNDLVKLGIIKSQPDLISPNPRKCLYQMRRCCSNGTFKTTPVRDTNLSLLSQCDPQSLLSGDSDMENPQSSPSPTTTGLLFVPKSVDSIKKTVAVLEQMK